MSRIRAIALVGALLLAGCTVKVRPAERAAAVPAHAESTLEFHLEQEWMPSELPSSPRGQAVWAANCMRCHGADGKPAVTDVDEDFSDPLWGRDQTPIEQVVMLWTGRGEGFEHPAFADSLTLQQVYDAVAYAEFLSTSIEVLRETNRTLFGTHCNVCHGNRGYGNGFLAPTMQPKPRNLSDFHHWGIHRTDAEIHDNIAKGLHWSAMPPWQSVLTDEQIWQLVDFIRSLQYVPPSDDEGGADAGGEGS